jgi:hypothetical protein
MTVPSRVTDFLRRRRGVLFCDTCMRVKLELARPQQAQQVTSALGTAPGFTRHKCVCSICKKDKTVIFAE